MKKLILAAGMALMATSAMAQTVVIAPETRTEIKEYVVKHKATSVELPSGVEIRSGVVLPETVELQTFDGISSASDYRYVVVDGRTVLVEPGTRRIIEVID